MADFFESFMAFEPHVLVRFGRWQQAIELPLPQDQDLYVTLTANVHYARGVAHAALGHIEQAEAEAAAFEAARARVPSSRYLHNNRMVDILVVGSHMLKGEVAYRKGDHAGAFEHLKAAVKTDD